MTHAVIVGPIRGDLTLEDGTTVDVRPEVVYLDTHEQALELADKVGQHYADNGHPTHDLGDGFVLDVKQSKKNFAEVQKESK